MIDSWRMWSHTYDNMLNETASGTGVSKTINPPAPVGGDVLMDDYIRRQDVIDELEERLKANGYSNVALVSELNRSIGYIMRIPSAPAREVKRGRWIERDGVYGDVYYECSVCGESWVTIEGAPKDNRMNYCPMCGADMREDDHDD